MARTRSSTETARNETPAPTAAENQLLRQQLRDMTQQLSALTEHVQTLSQRPAVPVVVGSTPHAEPTAPMAGPTTDGGATTVPPPTTTTEVPRAPVVTPSVGPVPTVLRATVEGHPRGSWTTPTIVTPTVIREATHLPTERDQKRANLAGFLKYNPPIFEGETTDPWGVERWVDTMEKLFEDLMVEDHERVSLAVHFLEGNARMWWKTTRPGPAKNAALPSWASFREKLFGAFFPRSVNVMYQILMHKLI